MGGVSWRFFGGLSCMGVGVEVFRGCDSWDKWGRFLGCLPWEEVVELLWGWFHAWEGVWAALGVSLMEVGCN